MVNEEFERLPQDTKDMIERVLNKGEKPDGTFPSPVEDLVRRVLDVEEKK